MLRLQPQLLKDLSFRSVLAAFAVMALAVLVRAWLNRLLPGLPPFITLYPAVALAGLLFGPLSTGLATVFGIAAAVFFWVPPRFSFAIHSVTVGVSVTLFTLASFLILWSSMIVRGQLNAAIVARQALNLGLGTGGVGTWELELRTRRIAASSAAYALHALPEGKTGTTLDDWLTGVHPDDVEIVRRVLQQSEADGSLATCTYRISGVEDEPRWISARGRVLSAGGVARLLCVLVDITEQVRVQDELRRERERLHLALSAGALAVWDYDPATDKVMIDAQYATKLGLDADVKITTRAQIGERIHPEDRLRVAEQHATAIARGMDYRIEYRTITQDGEVRWVVSQANLGSPGRIVGIIQDVTDRKRRESELRELAAQRELLIREADHRIKNSLQMVTSLLSLQLRSIADPDAASALRWAISRVRAIAASHLALQASEDLREVDLAIVLREVCTHFSELQPAISIVCRASEALILDADRAIPLGLAVSEVLTNALRHGFRGRPHGEVVVDAYIESSELIVRVGDDGIGMQPPSGELGLGSRIIRALASQLAATIEIDSSLDAGTRVTIRLPLAPAQPAQMAAGT